MALTLSERETIVVFDEQHDAAEVFTYNARLSRRLRELCEQRPADARLTKDNGSGGLTFRYPKAWIRVNPTRIMSDAQRAALEKARSTSENPARAEEQSTLGLRHIISPLKYKGRQSPARPERSNHHDSEHTPHEQVKPRVSPRLL